MRLDLELGDRVFVRNVGVPGKHKLADRWKSDVYVIEQKQAGIPVYTVKPELVVGPSKTYYRNLLLPVGSLPLRMESEVCIVPKRMKTRSQKPTTSHTDEGSTDSSNDEEWHLRPLMDGRTCAHLQRMNRRLKLITARSAVSSPGRHISRLAESLNDQTVSSFGCPTILQPRRSSRRYRRTEIECCC